jgi:dihydroorotate dehydrogenase subfamily 1
MGETSIFGKKISGELSTVSGILTTRRSIIQYVLREIPEIGLITTKSIGPEPREGNREPIITSVEGEPYTFRNAVGLTNPGAEKFREELDMMNGEDDKFLLVSVFSDSPEKIAEVIETLDTDVVDGFELNLSCPHAGHGGKTLSAIGSDPKLVRRYVEAAKGASEKPIIAKLSPNVESIGSIAKAAVEAGADGISAINTYRPEAELDYLGNPILTNKVGGKSGAGILEVGIRAIKDIRGTIGDDIPIIAMGGASSAEDIRRYKEAGANIVGIGSAIAGLSSNQMKLYFMELSNDLRSGDDHAKLLLKDVDMSYTPYKLRSKEELGDGLYILTLDGSFDSEPGEFVFLQISGEGEKPFSVLDNNPLTFSIQEKGCFTKKLTSLEEGSLVGVRGPCGNPIPSGGRKVLIAGGCGLASLYLSVKEDPGTEAVFLGASSKDRLFYLDKLSDTKVPLYISTDDGSFGQKGYVSDLLEEALLETEMDGLDFYVCGPKPMLSAVRERLLALGVEREHIFEAREKETKCGVGFCGRCATEEGLRGCVDGQYLGGRT